MKAWEWDIVYSVPAVQEIVDRVMEKYPLSEGEAKCRTEKATMKQVRENYARKLNEQSRLHSKA